MFFMSLTYDLKLWLTGRCSRPFPSAPNSTETFEARRLENPRLGFKASSPREDHPLAALLPKSIPNPDSFAHLGFISRIRFHGRHSLFVEDTSRPVIIPLSVSPFYPCSAWVQKLLCIQSAWHEVGTKWALSPQMLDDGMAK